MIESFRKCTLEAKLMCWLVLVNAYDFFSTKLIVGIVGPDGEANPAMRWVIENYGIWGVAWFKAFTLCVFWAAYTVASPESRLLKTKTVTFILIFLCSLLTGVCVWNTWCAYNVLTV